MPLPRTARTLAATAICICSAALAACQSAREEVTTSNLATYALTKRLGDTIARCWFDEASVPTFGKYIYSPEPGNSPPRVLIVPRDAPTERPVLVVEAVGAEEVNLFGPLLDTDAGPRIRADLARWTAGGEECR